MKSVKANVMLFCLEHFVFPFTSYEMYYVDIRDVKICLYPGDCHIVCLKSCLSINTRNEVG